MKVRAWMLFERRMYSHCLACEHYQCVCEVSYLFDVVWLTWVTFCFLFTGKLWLPVTIVWWFEVSTIESIKYTRILYIFLFVLVSQSLFWTYTLNLFTAIFFICFSLDLIDYMSFNLYKCYFKIQTRTLALKFQLPNKLWTRFNSMRLLPCITNLVPLLR